MSLTLFINGKDDKFYRENLDLNSEIEIPFTTAALGGVIKFPHWTGEINVPVPAGTQPDDYLNLHNCGINKAPYIGDMHLKCKISVPKKMNKKQFTKAFNRITSVTISLSKRDYEYVKKSLDLYLEHLKQNVNTVKLDWDQWCVLLFSIIFETVTILEKNNILS